MASLVKITGMSTVLSNLKRAEASVGIRAAVGLKAAGIFLQRESQRLVPVDTADLKASAFTRSSGFGAATTVTVGYTKKYAMFVHEAVGMKLQGQKRTGEGAKGRYWDPQGRAQAKFLEEPSRRLRVQIRAIIKRHIT